MEWNWGEIAKAVAPTLIKGGLDYFGSTQTAESNRGFEERKLQNEKDMLALKFEQDMEMAKLQASLRGGGGAGRTDTPVDRANVVLGGGKLYGDALAALAQGIRESYR